MVRLGTVRLGLAVVVLGLIGCKRGGAPADAEEPTPEVPTETPSPAPDGLAEAWAWMGLEVDLGDQVRLAPDFLRVEAATETADTLAEHYGAQLVAAGWVLESSTPGDPFRTDVYLRADMKLSLASGKLPTGGAGIGMTLGQHWPALALPRDGAVEIFEEPAVLVAVFTEDVGRDERVATFDAALTAAGWTQDRAEVGAHPLALGETRVVWYQQDLRSLRLEVFWNGDGQVQAAVQVGWR